MGSNDRNGILLVYLYKHIFKYGHGLSMDLLLDNADTSLFSNTKFNSGAYELGSWRGGVQFGFAQRHRLFRFTVS